MTNAPTYADEADRLYRESVRAVAQRLRDVADDVEREGLRVATVAGETTLALPYGQAASHATSSVMWGLANAGLPRMVRDASEADNARLKGCQ